MSYEMRLCPAHKERRPSFSVNTETGWGKCFACGHSERVFEGAEAPRPQKPTTPHVFNDAFIERNTLACHANLYTELMLEQRGLGVDAAMELGVRAVLRDDGVFIAFIYRDENHAPLYWKLRNTNGSKDRMERYPRGVASALYNLPALNDLRDNEEPVIVEGEFDVLALHHTGVRRAVSVPDGAGLKPGERARSLLAPLARFARVAVSVDADAHGESLAETIVSVLGNRCRRVVFREVA